jgi:hypothetical protein
MQDLPSRAETQGRHQSSVDDSGDDKLTFTLYPRRAWSIVTSPIDPK